MTVGAVVKLKSGGPPMTVVMVDGDHVICEWFNGAELKNSEWPVLAVEVTVDHRPFLVVPEHTVLNRPR